MLPAGAVYIVRVEPGWPSGKALGFIHTSDRLFQDGYPAYEPGLVEIAREAYASHEPVFVILKRSARGQSYVREIRKAA